MKRLEGVVRVDGDPALQTVHLEGDHTGLSPGLHVGQVLLSPDDVLQLLPDEDAAEEPVQGGDHPAAGAAGQLTGPAQLVECLGGEGGGDGGGPQSLGEDAGRSVADGDSSRCRGGARVAR